MDLIEILSNFIINIPRGYYIWACVGKKTQVRIAFFAKYKHPMNNCFIIEWRQDCGRFKRLQQEKEPKLFNIVMDWKCANNELTRFLINVCTQCFCSFITYCMAVSKPSIII